LYDLKSESEAGENNILNSSDSSDAKPKNK